MFFPAIETITEYISSLGTNASVTTFHTFARVDVELLEENVTVESVGQVISLIQVEVPLWRSFGFFNIGII